MPAPAVQPFNLDALSPAVREAFLVMQTEVAGLRTGTRRQDFLIAELRLWLTHQRSRISAKSRLGEKPGYIHRLWEGLQIFLTDGRVEMATNPVENTIRPITLDRKNALFAGHDEGGRTWARMASLVETCKLNAVDPYAFLRATLTAIANGHPASYIDELMPWAFPKPSG